MRHMICGGALVDWIQEKYLKAGHPETSIEELWMLAVDNIDNVRRRVAENSRTPLELLTVLSTDDIPEVRIAVAENPRTPIDLLAVLAVDEHADVRYSLAENPNLPIGILELLSEDDNPYVNHRAKRTLRILSPFEPRTFRRDSEGGAEEGYRWRKLS